MRKFLPTTFTIRRALRLIALAILATRVYAQDLQPAATNATELSASADASIPSIELRRNAGNAWRFFVNGEEFPLRGAGGAIDPGLLEQLKAAGGNCVRTWGIETLNHTYADGERFIDRAHRLGIMVVPGIWVQHERHGFDYTDPEVIRKQRDLVLESVRAYKNHPAVLAWGLGNEMEGPASPTGSVRVFREVEELAKLVKAEDPNHPVMSIIAFNPGKIANIIQYCPSLDILGVNSYGAASGAGPALKAAGWTKPFAVTEFGVQGFWEVGATDWGAPFEPNSQEKARAYYATQKLVTELNEGNELCLGTFAFLWGWKQEKTATWFGMFLPTGEKLPQVDAIAKTWTGHWPSNRCPKITKVKSAAYGQHVAPESIIQVFVDAMDPDGDEMLYEWQLVGESTARNEGGDAEETPPAYPMNLIKNTGAECFFKSPGKKGAYRLFLTIRDNKGNAATANFPFHVGP